MSNKTYSSKLYWTLSHIHEICSIKANIKIFYINESSILNPYSLADAFWCNSSWWLLKTLWPKVKLLIMSNFSFGRPTMFSTLFNNKAISYRDSSGFCHHVFKVVCCRFVVCGNGLNRVENIVTKVVGFSGVRKCLFVSTVYLIWYFN